MVWQLSSCTSVFVVCLGLPWGFACVNCWLACCQDSHIAVTSLKNIFSKFPEYNVNQKMNNSLNKDIKEDSEDTLNIIINKIKKKLDENPNFIINIKNLEELDISTSLVRKNGGLKKILEIIKNNNVI
jgi:hypothetical protein